MTALRSTLAGLSLLMFSAMSWAQPATSRAATTDDLRAMNATAQDVAEGRKVARDACARCHGANGLSATAGIPHIAGQRAAYLHAQLQAYKQGGRPQSPMSGAVGFLSDDALINVAAYYASLDPPARVATDRKSVV